MMTLHSATNFIWVVLHLDGLIKFTLTV